MIKKGIAASKGYAKGIINRKEEVTVDFAALKALSPQEESNRLKGAVEKTTQQLLLLRDRTREEVGEEAAGVFEAHSMFLEDPEFMGAIDLAIQEEGLAAEQAVKQVSDNFIAIFSELDDEYMKERAADVSDVSQRLVANLRGQNMDVEAMAESTVVVAKDLTPSDTASLDKSKVVAFITEVGGRTSHTAIMARTLEIPAIVGMGDILSHVKDGDVVLVDGQAGEVTINPSPEEEAVFLEKQDAYQKEREELKKLKDVQTVTADGKRVEVAGNIGNPKDVAAVLENGGEGIGLYRTEFLYMDRQALPTEEEQFEAYSEVLKAMGDRPVVIRTLDIGGDKKLPYLPLPEEMNPFLGYRAIRLCLDRPDLFKVQLRALLRASVFGNLRVMFPMISGLAEYRQAMALVKECQEELKKEGLEFNHDIQWGIMVEIPSAAVNAEELAKEVDFFSIGTNDLIQYTLAVDRMSEKVSYLYDPMHPAVLRLIKMTIHGAHSQGKWVGMCGEMAGDESAIPMLLSLGLDEFSMSASSILPARRLIMSSLSEAGQTE